MGILTGLFALISGALTGVVPRVITYLEKRQDHKHELEFLRLQHELQMQRQAAGTEDKLREIEAQTIAEEFRAMSEHLTKIIEVQARPSGFRWIDGWNALLRPAATTGIIVLYLWIASTYTGAIIGAFLVGKMSVGDFGNAVFNTLIGESIVAVLGFLFGYRGTIKRK
jgi:hypothetical protein